MEVRKLSEEKYECRMCGTEHKSEIEAIQCGCGFD
jgi:hypothetical protein